MNYKEQKKQVIRRLIWFFNHPVPQDIFVCLAGFLSFLTVVQGLLIIKYSPRSYDFLEFLLGLGLLLASAVVFFFTTSKFFTTPIKSPKKE